MAATPPSVSDRQAPSAEDQGDIHFIPFPPIERLAVIGDRRTAALIAADGTLCWLCLPRFDATPIFGALLDLQKGGFWRLGPEDREFGDQQYMPGAAVLVTRWETPEATLELTECMLWPQDERAEAGESRRAVVRRLACLSGQRQVTHRIQPREDFKKPATISGADGAMRVQTPSHDLRLWCSHPMTIPSDRDGAQLVTLLREGEEIWAVLDSAAEDANWSVDAARAELDETQAYWIAWSGRLSCTGPRAEEIRLAAIVVHLCTYAPTGAIIAAPTTSLPERVPGEYNYDYRYCWVRDGSIAAGLFAQLGSPSETGRFLTWVAERLRPVSEDPTTMPLQVLYRVDGGTKLPADERKDITGYRSCQPVRFGNPVYQMREIDGFGFLADCALLFARHGGALTEAHWELIRRNADFIAQNWREKDAGTWELMPFENFVVTKVMSWVTLDRSLTIAERLGHQAPPTWADARREVHDEVLRLGWSEKIGAFRQRYGSDALDGTLLLIPIMGFLPPGDPRVRSTVEAVDKVLKLNGLVHRFVPTATPGRPDHPMGDKEGAFLMCNFWLSQAWSILGEPERAEAALARAEACRGTTRLFSEAADSRHAPGLLGNMPLLFSQVEYARAARALK